MGAQQTVYIAGPMRGIAEFNFPAFDDAATRWRRQGFAVISPAEHDQDGGFHFAQATGNEDLTALGFDLTAALMWDLEQVAASDGLILLKGWPKSSGAKAEVALAAALGKWAIEDEFGGEPVLASSLTPTLSTHSGPSGEVRVTNATTGGEKGTKEARFDLIPIHPLTELARLYGRGASKYADRNWERGYDWSLSYAALMRHLTQWWGGEDIDPEMGLSHLASVAWHAFSLAEFERTHPELDTRP